MTFAIHGATKSKARAARRQLALNTLQSLAVQRRTRRSSLSHADAAQTLYAIRRLAEVGSVLTVEPYLPMLLNLDGAPYTLAEHQPFAPLFRTQLPQRMVWRTGRQVSKSTSVMSSMLIRSNWIPNFKSICICPLYEQIRRLSALVARPFIENSPVRSLWTGSNTQQSVLQYSFRNQSRVVFSFALLDASRIRGLSADFLSIDESFCGETTYVKTSTGLKRIIDVNPGEEIDSFTRTGKLTRDRVVKVSDHGWQRCWRVTLSNGRFIDATAESWFATNRDWKRLDTLITDTASAGTGDPVGGLRHAILDNPKGPVHQPTRLEPACIQLSEIPDIVRVREHATKERQERRFREVVQSLGDNAVFSAELLQVPVLPGKSGDWTITEIRPTNLARSNHRRGPGLVAGRRRLIYAKYRLHNIPYGRFQPARGGAAMSMASSEMADSVSSWACTQPQEPRQVLLDNPAAVTRQHPPQRVGAAVSAGMHALQIAQRTSTLSDDLLPLRSTDRTYRNEAEATRQSKNAKLLPSQSMQVSLTSTGVQEICGKAGTAGNHKCETSRKVPGESGSQPRTRQENSSEVQRTTPGASQTIQTETVGQASGSSQTTGLDLSALWIDRTTGRSGYPYKVLRRLPFIGNRRKQSKTECQRQVETCTEEGQLEPVTIQSITYLGYRHVWDIETEQNNCFIANGVGVHNCQDFDKRHLPIVIECLSASKKWAIEQYTGTPLTFDNTIEELFSKSSQAHWFTTCLSCGEHNIASQDYHLLKMIGPYRDDISVHQPGTICHRCQRPINPATGRWRHKYDDKHWDFAGYHVPQIIMPLHYASPKKWAALLRKQNSGTMAPYAFYNEVLGESYDVGSKLLTKTDLRNAACLPWRNEPRTSQPTRQIDQRLRYRMTALAIDWGGGGEKHESYTAMSLLGITAGGKIHVIWGRRLYTPNDHILEANEIVHWVNVFKPDIVVHDATGAGSLRESVLVQSRRLQNIKFVPIEYVGPMNSLVKYVPPSPENSRARWRVDKTRSLLYMIHGIRTGYIQTFAYDHVSEEEPGLLHDLLALVQEKVDGLSGRDVYRITRAQGASDDFAHSVNLGAVALWHSCNAWPNFYTSGKDHPDSGFVPFEEAVLQVAGDRTHGWETDPSPSFQPNVAPA